MMNECKRFYCNIIRGSRQVIITDCHTCKSATIDVYDDDFKYFVDLLNEQQATIRKLQDLCGESDYENAKLREEVNLLRPTNIEQYEQIQKLQEENEQLKKELKRICNLECENCKEEWCEKK